MTKEHVDALVKAYRLIRVGTTEGERLARQSETDESLIQQLIENVQTMHNMTSEMKNAIEMYFGADFLLKQIADKRGKPTKASRKPGRPKLQVLKGGG